MNGDIYCTFYCGNLIFKITKASEKVSRTFPVIMKVLISFKFLDTGTGL